MEVLSGPWADMALLLRQIILQTDKQTDSFLPLFLIGLLLFLSVCLLLLQLIIYLNWKLKQVEGDLQRDPQDRSALLRQRHRSTHLRRRSFG